MEVKVKIFTPVELDEKWLDTIINGQKRSARSRLPYVIIGDITKHTDGCIVYECTLKDSYWWYIMDVYADMSFPEDACIVEWWDGKPGKAYFWNTGKGLAKPTPLEKILETIPKALLADMDDLTLSMALTTYFGRACDKRNDDANSIHVKVDKYEIVINNSGNFDFYALRYGEPWIPDLTMVEGSNMILAMAYEIQELRRENEDQNVICI